MDGKPPKTLPMKKKVKKPHKRIKKKQNKDRSENGQELYIKDEYDTNCDVQKPPSKGKRFKEQFRLFAILGDVRNSGSTITHENSLKWLKQASIIDNRIVTIHDAEIHFINELKRQRSLTILEYINFLKALCSEKGIETSLVIHRLIDCGPPIQNMPLTAEKRQSEPNHHTLPIYLTKIALDVPRKRSSFHVESEPLIPTESSKVPNMNDVTRPFFRPKRSIDVKRTDFLPTAKIVSLHLAKCFENTKHLGIKGDKSRSSLLESKMPETRVKKYPEKGPVKGKELDAKSERSCKLTSKMSNLSTGSGFQFKSVNQTATESIRRLLSAKIYNTSQKPVDSQTKANYKTSLNIATSVAKPPSIPPRKITCGQVTEKINVPKPSSIQMKRVEAKLELRHQDISGSKDITTHSLKMDDKESNKNSTNNKSTNWTLRGLCTRKTTQSTADPVHGRLNKTFAAKLNKTKAYSTNIHPSLKSDKLSTLEENTGDFTHANSNKKSPNLLDASEPISMLSGSEDNVSETKSSTLEVQGTKIKAEEDIFKELHMFELECAKREPNVKVSDLFQEKMMKKRDHRKRVSKWKDPETLVQDVAESIASCESL